MKLMEMVFSIVIFIHIMLMLKASPDIGITHDRLKFLQDKGYLENPSQQFVGALQSKEVIVDALKRFQEYAGIPVTGRFDHNTIVKFQQPRCGMKDVMTLPSSRKKRYVLQGDRWDKKVLTFQVVNYSNDISRVKTHRAITEALRKWEKASQMKFYEVNSGNADIMIKFTRSNHGDPYPFDGPGGTLAHAFYPGDHELAGDTHFDDDELFTLNSDKGKDLSWVALHEFGHALGLEHAHTKFAIMYPWYDTNGSNKLQLFDDDKLGIQDLYGAPDTNEVPEQPLDNEVLNCVRHVDSVFLNRVGHTVVTYNKHVYVFNHHMCLVEGPELISTMFNGIAKVDASFQRKNGRVVFLYGDLFWEYSGTRLVKGPDRSTKIGLTSEMVHLDAAVKWHVNGKVYFFKGDKYWRYNERLYRIDPGYPKLIKDSWIGVPANIDGAFEWKNRIIYFFKGSNYYRFDNRRFEVSQGYPLPFKHNLFHCRKHQTNKLPLSSNILSSYSIQNTPPLMLIVMLNVMCYLKLQLF